MSACSDSLLEVQNKNTLSIGSFFKTENDLLLAVNSAYCPLEGFGLFGQKYFFVFNTLNPYIWFETPKAGLDQMTISTNDFTEVWKYLYYGVYRTSDILANADRLKNVMTEAKLNEYKAQLRALRGMYYFYLVTWFDRPVFYDETNVPYNSLIGYSNGTQKQFWDKLEDDLTFAAAHLPVSWTTTDKGRITQGAAQAQLGKALLFKHYHYYLRFGMQATAEAQSNLQKSKNALKAVIDGGNYQLTLPVSKTKADYQALLLANFSYIDIPVGSYSYKAENNNESVWEVQFNSDTRGQDNHYLPGFWTGGNMLQVYFSPNPSGYRNQEIDPTLWTEFESVSSHPSGYEKDPRAYATCYLEGDSMDWRPGTTADWYNKKFSSDINTKKTVFTYNLYQGTSPSKAIGLKKYFYPQYFSGSADVSPNNVRVIRYSDVLLMYSEACYLVDSDADGSGLDALNLVRKRVDMPVVTTLTPTAIVHERNVELATEGHHYHDLIRWSYDPQFNVNLTTIIPNFDKSKNMYFPIPQSEIDANLGVLKQNPGW